LIPLYHLHILILFSVRRSDTRISTLITIRQGNFYKFIFRYHNICYFMLLLLSLLFVFYENVVLMCMLILCNAFIKNNLYPKVERTQLQRFSLKRINMYNVIRISLPKKCMIFSKMKYGYINIRYLQSNWVYVNKFWLWYHSNLIVHYTLRPTCMFGHNLEDC
jgi:hypothetical protein